MGCVCVSKQEGKRPAVSNATHCWARLGQQSEDQARHVVRFFGVCTHIFSAHKGFHLLLDAPTGTEQWASQGLPGGKNDSYLHTNATDKHTQQRDETDWEDARHAPRRLRRRSTAKQQSRAPKREEGGGIENFPLGSVSYSFVCPFCEPVTVELPGDPETTRPQLKCKGLSSCSVSPAPNHPFLVP